MAVRRIGFHRHYRTHELQAGYRMLSRAWPMGPFVCNAGSSTAKCIQSLLTFLVTQLEKHMLGDKLNDKISNRPAPETLVKDGVLREDPRSAEERYEEAIEDEYAKREGGA